ncbi:MAG: ATP-binding protein [Armatimonadota bacterium]
MHETAGDMEGKGAKVTSDDLIPDPQDQLELTKRLRAQALSIIGANLQDVQTHTPLDLNQIIEYSRPTLGGTVPVGLYRTVRLLAFREVLGDKISSSILSISGRSIAEKMDIPSIKDLIDILESMSIAKLSIEMQSDDLVIISAEECATCSGLPNVGTPLCCFEGGFIAGGLEKINGSSYRALETHCWGLGDSICTWQLTKIDGETCDGCESTEPLDMIIALADKAASSVDAAIAIHNKNIQLREANKRIREAEKLKQDLNDMIVHDMRVPLTAVIGSLEMITDMMGTDTSAQETKLMKIAVSSSQMLMDMVSDLQDISRIEDRKLKLTCDIVSPEFIIRQAINGTEHLTGKKKLKVIVDIPESLPDVSADKERLARVLINLISNAVRFTPNGGTISINAIFNYIRNTVCISIKDTGEGIPEEYHKRIFDKFFQIESNRIRSRNTSGLGLAYCKTMTEAHGGRIYLQSEPGQGSTFTLELPAIQS